MSALIVYLCIIPAAFLFGGLGVKKVLEWVGALKTESMYIDVPNEVYTEDIISATIEAYVRGLPAGAARKHKIIVLWDSKAPRSYEELRYREELTNYIFNKVNNNVWIKEY